VELGATIKDRQRLERAKKVLFETQHAFEARNPAYPFWQFDEIAWTQAKPLGITSEEKDAIIEVLERALALRVNASDPAHFDSITARDAADRLRRWREQTGQLAEARRAADTAGAALGGSRFRRSRIDRHCMAE
jgi:hypothetical protein